MTSRFYVRALFVSIVIVIISVGIVYLSGLSRREPKTFRIYYDKINSMMLCCMSQYDINIVEASFFEKKDVEYLHDNQSQVVGYISLVEIGYWDTPLIQDLHEEDYLLDESNKRMKDLGNTNYLGDLSSPHFRKVLFDHIDRRILDKGMDGVFFDTLDWIDYYTNNTRIYDKLTSGYKAFLIELRERYPEIMIIQNRGFESYRQFSHDYIDGILWENFNSPYDTKNTKKIEDLEEIRKMTRSNKTDVFVISFENECKNREIAEKFHWNFLYSQMENRYSEWDILVR